MVEPSTTEGWIQHGNKAHQALKNSVRNTNDYYKWLLKTVSR